MAASTLLGIGSSSSKSSISLAISGLASGMNWATIVSELATAERAPETQWKTEQTTIAAEQTAYASIESELSTLQLDAENLQDPSFFKKVTATSSDTTVASASVSSGTPIGDYTFDISQLASASQLLGTSYVSNVLVPDGNPSDLTIGSAGFSTPVTAGTFSVNGKSVTVAATDSLQDVFNAIATATGNKVTAGYSAATDKITLTSSDGSAITLGSSADTSNFLKAAELFTNNGGSTENTGTVSSTEALGRVNTNAIMSSSDLKTAITDGGSGAGAFTINGVSFSYNATTDSIQNILDNINESSAGVSAAYDSINNQFVLTNTSTGDTGISMADVTGNFLAATGLSSGTLTLGNNLEYTLNGGSQSIISQSNTIDSTSSGVTGLSLAVASKGATTVSVAADTSTISNQIQQFVTDYNTLQNFLTSQQAVTTAADGTVTPGTLTGDEISNDVIANLRSTIGGSVRPSSGISSVTQLSDLGFESNGANNTISLSDSSTLTAMLSSHLSDVQALFSNTTSGLAVKMNNYISNVIGTNGSLPTRTADLTQQTTDITTQISNLETKIGNDTAMWDSEFQAMETAESQTNQELTYLSQEVSSGSL
jgi:flagellar hook-associated protein 2